MSTMPATANKLQQIEQRMAALGVLESDVEETFVRSGGPGGQKVNKSSSCVMLFHRPTGLRVKCQTSRQQGVNRLLAREMLLGKIEAMRRSAAEAERTRAEKTRRQKRQRSRGAKERMLKQKAKRGETKRLRATVRE